jgi:hypothetical protein
MMISTIRQHGFILKKRRMAIPKYIKDRYFQIIEALSENILILEPGHNI